VQQAAGVLADINALMGEFYHFFLNRELPAGGGVTAAAFVSLYNIKT
jgi:hypothetical protein